MKLNKLIVGISSLVVASYMMDFSQRKEVISSLDEKIVEMDSLDIVKANPVKSLSKRDSLNLLSYGYMFNEKDLAKYNSWIDSTINESKINNSYAIIVNKSDYKLFLYKDGIKIKDFPIELGWSPYDDKQMEGDMKTPEGMYVVEQKVTNGTRFHKALLINYPNSEDLIEFNRLKRNKIIEQYAKIGNAIEIHGKGSGYAGGSGYDDMAIMYPGNNWTSGCVALSNEQIDQIFPLVPKGARVTIVKFTDKELY